MYTTAYATKTEYMQKQKECSNVICYALPHIMKQKSGASVK